MKHRLFLFSVQLFLTLSLYAQVTQEWVAEFHGHARADDHPYAIAIDTAGYVYVAGAMNDNSDGSTYVTIKYDKAGEQLWVRTYDGPNGSPPQHYASAITVDHEGNVYVTGASAGVGTRKDYATLKYDTHGKALWVARYNGPGNMDDIARAIDVDREGNVYVTGSSFGERSSEDYATIKYSGNGVAVWIARYNGTGNGTDYATSVKVNREGNVFVTGASMGIESGVDYATLKYSPSGMELWEVRYTGWGTNADVAKALTYDASGNVYVTGWSAGINAGNDYATLKYDSEGRQRWLARYDGSGKGNDAASAIAVDRNGNVYVTGTSLDANESMDFATIKYSPGGVRQWVQRFNSPTEESHNNVAHALALDKSANIYVTGFSESSKFHDFVTVKYDSAGVEHWVQRFRTAPAISPKANSLSVDRAGNVYVTALGWEARDNVTFATVRYSQDGATPEMQAATSEDDVERAKALKENALKLFLDCDGCYEDFIKTELTLFNYVRDRELTDLHILITKRQAANEGTEYTLTIIGSGKFDGMTDTLSFVTMRTDTDDMTQNKMVRFLKLGLVRYLAKTPMSDLTDITFAAGDGLPSVPESDPWDSWVFSSDMNVSFYKEKSTSSVSLFGSLSANRVTPERKLRMGFSGSYAESNFTFDEGTISSFARSWDYSGLYVEALGDHWSTGVFANAWSSSFSNIDMAFGLAPAVEFNVYPYSENTRKQFTFLYRIGATRFKYIAETLFDRTSETLTSHTLTAFLSLKQPWGTASVSLEGSQFLHDLTKNRLEFSGELGLRLVEGLSLNLSGNVSIIHDQLSLPKLGATPEEVLLRRRELATTFNYSASLGLSYTFGSIYSNVVNPRFGR